MSLALIVNGSPESETLSALSKEIHKVYNNLSCMPNLPDPLINVSVINMLYVCLG